MKNAVGLCAVGVLLPKCPACVPFYLVLLGATGVGWTAGSRIYLALRIFLIALAAAVPLLVWVRRKTFFEPTRSIS